MDINLFQSYLNAYDKITDRSILQDDFQPEEKDYERLTKSDITGRKIKNFYEMSLPELKDSIDPRYLNQVLEFLTVNNPLKGNFNLRSEKYLKGFKRDLESLTRKDYKKLDKDDFISDALFFTNVADDVVAKGIMTSKRINDIFKIHHDMFLDDIEGGNIFYEGFKRKLEKLKEDTGSDNWDEMPVDTFFGALGMDVNEVFKTLNNPARVEETDIKGEDKKEAMPELKSAYTRIMGDMDKGSPQVEEEIREVKKGNFKLKKEGDNGGSNTST